MSDNTRASTAVFRRTISRERANFGFHERVLEVGSGLDRKILDRNRLRPKPPGGARRDRTDDLLLAKQALSQLSYGPVPVSSSRQPSLAARAKNWWAWEDLNFRPHAYQARALTN